MSVVFIVNSVACADLIHRYLSQVRQELAIRLLQRVYAGGNTPSKVRLLLLHMRDGILIFW